MEQLIVALMAEDCFHLTALQTALRLNWTLPVSIRQRGTHITPFGRQSIVYRYLWTWSHCRDLATGHTRHFVKGTAANNLTSNDVFVTEDSKGQIWVGTNGQGVNVLHNDDRMVTKLLPHSPGPVQTMNYSYHSMALSVPLRR